MKRSDVEPKDTPGQDVPRESTVSDDSRKQTKHDVFVYATVMFGVFVLLILLSYFIQQRNSSKTISNITEQHGRFSTQALENIEALQNKNIELAEDLGVAKTRIEELEKEKEKARQQYEDDLRETEEKLKAEYNEIKGKMQALEYLIDAEIALRYGDNAAAREKIRLLESVAASLDDAYREEFETLKERLY